MSDSPFRARRLSPSETRRIVKRASELAELDRAAATDGGGLTEDELAQRLRDLGLPDDAVRRAMTAPEVDAPTPLTEATRIVREETIEGMLAPDRHEIVAEEISRAMKLPGRVEVVGQKLKWTMGILMDPSVTVHSKDGRTVVRVEETLANKGQLIVAGITFAAFAALLGTVPGMGIAKLLGDSAADSTRSVLIIAAVAIACALASIAGLRAIFRRRIGKRTVAIDEAIDRIATVVRSEVTSTEPAPRAAKTRIAPPKSDVRAPIAAEFEEDSQATAEAEREAEAALDASETKTSA